MTKIITRYFGSAEIARRVRQELVDIHRLSPRIIDLFDQAEGLAARLDAAQVAPATSAAYAQKLAGGGAVLLVRAGHKPLSVGRITREVTAAMNATRLSGKLVLDSLDHSTALEMLREVENNETAMRAKWGLL